MKIYLTVVALGVLIFSPMGLVLADDVQIHNNVSVSADTGGNTGGNVSEGTAKVQINITGEVNGKEIEPVSVNEEATSGGAIKEQVKVETINGETKAEVKSEVKPSTDAKSEAASVDESHGESNNQTVNHELSEAEENSGIFRKAGNFIASIGNFFWRGLLSIFS